MFNLGHITIEQRALIERLFWAVSGKILRMMKELDYAPEELQGLASLLSDTYFCNFSVFQSMPDSWAVKQLFPVMPIHRLNEAPTRRGVLGDITCDSDGKIDQFIDLRDVRSTLELHPYTGDELIARLRKDVERAVRNGKITLNESKLLLRFYESGLDGYTYLEE